MMKRYRVQLNGKSYDVVVEEVAESAGMKVVSPKTTAETPIADAATAHASHAPVEAPKPAAAARDEVIAAPMPGKVLSIKVKPGQEVKEGDVILLLEAMKMENEIFCGRAGTVKSILVAENATVNTGDTLAIIG